MNEIDYDTEVWLGLICRVPLSEADRVKRSLAGLGCRIVYQRISIEPLRIEPYKKAQDAESTRAEGE
jgi:hypothetical protein